MIGSGTRHGYDARALADQFAARIAEVHQLFRGTLDARRSRELVDDMRAAGLPFERLKERASEF